MDNRTIRVVLAILTLLSFALGQESKNEVIPSEAKSVATNWMKGAQHLLAGPTGEMMVQIAKELISRSSGASQILSLNLGNLFILLILKALIFAVGMIGAGNFSHYARRIDSDDNIFLPGEPTLMIGYLAAEGSGRNGCLHKAACSSPQVAFEYARAAKALLNGMEIFQGEISDKHHYKGLIDLVEKSAYNGFKGAPCEMIYRCDL